MGKTANCQVGVHLIGVTPAGLQGRGGMAVVASLWSYGGRTEELVFQQNRTTARLLVDQSLYIEHWEKLETDARFIPMVQDVADNLRRHEYEYPGPCIYISRPSPEHRRPRTSSEQEGIPL